jgi:hypothetical protein
VIVAAGPLNGVLLEPETERRASVDVYRTDRLCSPDHSLRSLSASEKNLINYFLV